MLNRNMIRLMMIAFLLFLINAVNSSHSWSASPDTFIDGAGLYGLLSGGVCPSNRSVKQFLEAEALAGISVRVVWNTIQPQEGMFDWSYTDDMIQRVQRFNSSNNTNKKVMLRILTGINTPAWVYTAGAQPFTFCNPPISGLTCNQDSCSSGECQFQIPVPWDTVYQAKLQDLITAYGQKYNDNSLVFLVHVSGPSTKSAEMILPKTAADKQEWDQIGYTPELLTGAFNQVIDYYNDSFPNKPWSVNLGVPIFTDGVVGDVASYCASTYPWQCGMQVNCWNANSHNTYPPVAALIDNVDGLTHGGVQSLGPFGGRAGSIDQGQQIAIDWHAVTWAEIYLPNIDQFTTLPDQMTIDADLISSINFNVGNVINGEVKLTWDTPMGDSNFTGLTILRKTGGFPDGISDLDATTVFSGNSNTTSFTDTGLDNSTTYFYSIIENPTTYTIGQGKANPSS